MLPLFFFSFNFYLFEILTIIINHKNKKSHLWKVVKFLVILKESTANIQRSRKTLYGKLSIHFHIERIRENNCKDHS